MLGGPIGIKFCAKFIKTSLEKEELVLAFVFLPKPTYTHPPLDVSCSSKQHNKNKKMVKKNGEEAKEKHGEACSASKKKGLASLFLGNSY